MEYRIEVSPAALEDIKSAYTWLKERSVFSADQWYDGLFDAILSLRTMPARCALATESEDLKRQVRQLLHGQGSSIYRILFTINEDRVRVHRVRHSARKRVKMADFPDWHN